MNSEMGIPGAAWSEPYFARIQEILNYHEFQVKIEASDHFDFIRASRVANADEFVKIIMSLLRDLNVVFNIGETDMFAFVVHVSDLNSLRFLSFQRDFLERNPQSLEKSKHLQHRHARLTQQINDRLGQRN
ncbi:MAG: hypothetical protein HS115_19235 [Spirochaetales bacterium]|nr:hypothetical protein [Spirochaetales bacterium]